jgi:hypothetical protein
MTERAGFRLWIAAVVVLSFALTVIATAWATRHAILGGRWLNQDQAETIIFVASLPSAVRDAALEIGNAVADEPGRLLFERRSVERTSWQRRFPAPDDPGYLLFSGVDPQARRSIVALVRIADGRELVRWSPDWNRIVSRISPAMYFNPPSRYEAEAGHPLLLSDGSIVFTYSGAMMRLGVCQGTPTWVLNESLHHSNELDDDGNIWVPSFSNEGFADNPWLQQAMRDDALAKVSPEGRLLERRSFTRILRDNGLQALLIGSQGPQLNDDPIHMNQISVARATTDHWERGDLLVTSRHLSTVFLYRPSTDRIVWHRTGPWLTPHAAAFAGDHAISVFSNNIVSGAPGGHAFLVPGDFNRVMVHDFRTGEVSEPYLAQLESARPVTVTGGRARLLPDGGLFVEETDHGRHLRFTREGLLWSRVNDYDATRIGAVMWSRYLTAEEVKAPLGALSGRGCAPS